MKLSSVRRALAAVVTAGLVAAPLVVSAPADAGKPKQPTGQAGDRDDPQPLPRCGHQPARHRRPGRPGARWHPAADPRRPRERDARDAGHRRRHRLHRPRGPAGRRDRGDRAGPDRAPGGRLVEARRSRARQGRPGQRDRDRLRLPADAARRARRASGREYVPVSIAAARRRRGAQLHRQPLHRHHGRRRPRRPADHARRRAHARRGRADGARRGPGGVRRTTSRSRCWATRSASTAGTSGSTCAPAPSGSGSSTPTSRRSAPTSRYAQAAQLLAEATAEDTTTVFVCDCNSDPLNNSDQAAGHAAAQGGVRADHRRRWLHRRVAGVGPGRGGLDLRPQSRPSTTRPATTSTTASTWSSPGPPPATRSPSTGAGSPAPTCPPRTRPPASGPPTTAGWCSGSAASEADPAYSRAFDRSSAPS